MTFLFLLDFLRKYFSYEIYYFDSLKSVKTDFEMVRKEEEISSARIWCGILP